MPIGIQPRIITGLSSVIAAVLLAAPEVTRRATHENPPSKRPLRYWGQIPGLPGLGEDGATGLAAILLLSNDCAAVARGAPTRATAAAAESIAASIYIRLRDDPADHLLVLISVFSPEYAQT
jgi:hypothetical protein